MQLAHANETQVGQIREAVSVSLGQFGNPKRMIGQSERGTDQSVTNKVKNQRGVAQMERRLGENGFTCEQRIYYLMCEANGPFVMKVAAIAKRNQEASVSDGIHFFEKPLREERVALADTFPANRRNGRSSRARAFSN